MKTNQKTEKVTLKTLREATGLTQPELSVKLKFGLKTIGNWENGHSLPRLDRAVALAREFGVSLKVLSEAMDIDVSGVPDDNPSE